MNIIVRCVGYMMYKLQNCALKYKSERNQRNVAAFGAGSQITGNCSLSFPKNIYVGSNTYLNGGDFVASPNGKIVFGNNCLISYNVHIRTDMHLYSNPNKPINQQGHAEQDVVIGDDVWIGYGAQIMSGITVGKGCIIGAGAVVTKNTEPYGVYVGVPAKRIKERKTCEGEHTRDN